MASIDFSSAEWSDVTPIPQNDGPDPVVPIAYSFDYKEAMNYFRALLQSDERSARALALTSRVIDLNSANYTAWQFRRLCLEALESDLHDELAFVTEIALETPKNYQLWHHRRLIVQKLGDASQELSHTKEILKGDNGDAKNYHAWSHRQWACRHFSEWDAELSFCAVLLRDDLRNNSAWNHRFFVIEQTSGFTDEVSARELNFVTGLLRQAPNNESAWNFLRGLIHQPGFSLLPSVVALIQEVVTQLDPDCVHAFGLLVDISEQSGDQQKMNKACEICERLRDKLDAVRHKYWQFKLDGLRSASASSQQSSS